MDYFEEFSFKTPKQERSKRTIEDIMQAIEELTRTEELLGKGELENISTRDLADHSGHAIGTIFHHFNKFDDIYVYVFMRRRKKSLLKVLDIISQHPADQPISVLIKNLIESMIGDLSRPPRKVLIFFMNRYLKHAKIKTLLNPETDVLIPLWINAGQRNNTQTFLKLNEDELRLRIRTIHSMTMMPFFEDDPIAGTPAHIEMAVNIANKLFSVPDLSE